MPKGPITNNADKFDWNDFLKPNTAKIGVTITLGIIAFVWLVLVIILLRSTLSCCSEIPPGPLENGVRLIIGLFLLIFSPPVIVAAIFGWLLSLLSNILLWIAYLLFIPIMMGYVYVIGCFVNSKLKPGQLMPFIVLILVTAFILTIIAFPKYDCPENRCGNYVSMAQCKAQVATVGACYTAQGNWDSNGCGIEGCLASYYGLNDKCLIDGGPLEDTSWKKDETHFNCGLQPA